MMDRWVEKDLLNVLDESGIGAIAFSPLEQGILTNKYLNGFPEDSRAVKDGRYLKSSNITSTVLSQVKKLNDLAEERGQSLAQMAIAWLLKSPTITSVLVGVSKASQLQDNVNSLQNLSFTEDELLKIETILKS
jgi:L-glyceraldehyde 3-phosphate reductase